MALVRGVIAASTAAGSMSRYVSSTSTNTGGRADPRHGFGGRDEGVRGEDDLVAGADADRAVGEFERVRAVGRTDALANADVFRVLVLELGDFGSADERRRLELRPPLGQHGVGDLRLLRGQVEEWH